MQQVVITVAEKNPRQNNRSTGVRITTNDGGVYSIPRSLQREVYGMLFATNNSTLTGKSVQIKTAEGGTIAIGDPQGTTWVEGIECLQPPQSA